MYTSFRRLVSKVRHLSYLIVSPTSSDITPVSVLSSFSISFREIYSLNSQSYKRETTSRRCWREDGQTDAVAPDRFKLIFSMLDTPVHAS